MLDGARDVIVGLRDRRLREVGGHNAISIARAMPVVGQIDQIRIRVERLTHGGKGAGWKPDGAVLAFDVPT